VGHHGNKPPRPEEVGPARACVLEEDTPAKSRFEQVRPILSIPLPLTRRYSLCDRGASSVGDKDPCPNDREDQAGCQAVDVGCKTRSHVLVISLPVVCGWSPDQEPWPRLEMPIRKGMSNIAAVARQSFVFVFIFPLSPVKLIQTHCSRKVGRSQRIDATLAWSLLAGVSKSKVCLGR
jgi:hypothetical protein